MPSTLVSSASLCVRRRHPFSFRLLKKFFLSLPLDISLLRGRAGGCTPGGDFCTAESAISAPAKLNCCSRGGERMAARGPANVATEGCENGGRRRRRQETSGNVLPHGGDSADGEIAVPPEVALNFARSRRRSCANS